MNLDTEMAFNLLKMIKDTLVFISLVLYFQKI